MLCCCRSRENCSFWDFLKNCFGFESDNEIEHSGEEFQWTRVESHFLKMRYRWIDLLIDPRSNTTENADQEALLPAKA